MTKFKIKLRCRHRRTGLQNLGGGGADESLKCHFLPFGGEILCMNEEKMLGILMKQDQVVGKTKLISGKQDDCPTFK